MPEGMREKQDHPYVAHYDWSAVPGEEDLVRLTPAQEAENAQHACDKEAVESGNTLRLVLAAPVIIWGVVALPALLLVVLVLILSAFDRSLLSSFEASWGLAGFLALLLLIEAASIWEGKLLLRNELSPRQWLGVLLLTLTVAVTVTVALALRKSMSTEGWAGVAVVWYCVAVAGALLVRVRRLAPAARRLEHYSP